MNKIIKISLIVSILGLLSGCGGLSKQERLAIAKAKQERVLKRKKIREERKKRLEAKRQAEIKAKKLAEEKKAKEEARKKASTVEATGYGNTKEEALKNAFSTAVSEYVGVVVDAKEVTKNGKLIEDKILTFSNGYIDNYKTISSKEQMGLWEIKIAAIIKQQEVLKEVKKLKIKAKDIKGSEARYAKLVSQVKSKFDAEDMIVNLVKEYSGKNIYKLYDFKIDDVKIFEDEATRKYVPIQIKLSLVLNKKVYQQVVQKFHRLFKGIGGKIIKEIHWKNSIIRNKPKDYEMLDWGYTKHIETKDRMIILVKDKQNAEIWQFPKSYKVIYPFKDVYHSSNWIVQYIDGNKHGIIKSYDLRKLFGAKVVFLDKEGNHVLKSLKFNPSELYDNEIRTKLSLFRESFMIFPSDLGGNRYTNMAVKKDYYGKFNIPVSKIKNLKQIKIEWNNHGI
jgi:hypothetical protein